jgi:hypothetical protein
MVPENPWMAVADTETLWLPLPAVMVRLGALVESEKSACAVGADVEPQPLLNAVAATVHTHTSRTRCL